MAVPAGQFKARCLKLMDQVQKSREPVVITKHGRPVAQLAPVGVPAGSLFGYMRGTLRVRGDVVLPLHERWSAETGDEDYLYSPVAAGSGRRRVRKK